MAKLKGIEGKGVGTLLAGNMYFYKYIAEDENDFYDMFPLVFILKVRGKLIEGINFHYLDIKRRIALFDLILPFVDSDVIEKDSRLRVKTFRKIILTSKKYRDAKVIIHRYKRSNIRSAILKIDPTKWKLVLKEELELFKIPKGGKLPSPKVWRKTLIESRTS